MTPTSYPTRGLFLLALVLLSSCFRSAPTSPDVVALLNRDLGTHTIEDVRFDYQLDFVEDRAGYFESNLTMIVRDAGPSGRRLFGDGLAWYYRRGGELLAQQGLEIKQTHFSDTPLRDASANTLTWRQKLGIGPPRK